MAIGTIRQLAAQPGMPSVVTLRLLIARHPDFPIIRRGTRGRGYRIDLEAAAEFVATLKAPRKLTGSERLEMIQALGLELIDPNIKENLT